MMAGGRPRMLTEDDIKKRKEFLQRCFEYREFDLLCCMHVRFAITLSLRTHVRRVMYHPLHLGCRSGDQDKRRKRADARRGMLEQAEQFKDDDVNVSHVVRLSVWEQFSRVIREVYDKSIK